ncbi:MAG: hypothetical protein IJ313_03305 [Clostridia bacterium]|nr:hypothetical protein [Clostridia bacterium]
MSNREIVKHKRKNDTCRFKPAGAKAILRIALLSFSALRAWVTLGCRPNPLEGFHPSNSLLRFAPVLSHIISLVRIKKELSQAEKLFLLI